MRIPTKKDPDTLKIPAYMRSKAIVQMNRQRLLWTAWDRKDAGVKPNSKQALGTPGKLRATEQIGISNSLTSRVKPGKNYLSSTPLKLSATRGNFYTKRAGASAKRTSPIPTPAKRPQQGATKLQYLSPKKLLCAGVVTHFLGKISVAIIKISRPLQIGDLLLLEGNDLLFLQPIEEMQIERKPVQKAAKSAHIGLKVVFEPKVNGKIFKF